AGERFGDDRVAGGLPALREQLVKPSLAQLAGEPSAQVAVILGLVAGKRHADLVEERERGAASAPGPLRIALGDQLRGALQAVGDHLLVAEVGSEPERLAQQLPRRLAAPALDLGAREVVQADRQRVAV